MENKQKHFESSTLKLVRSTITIGGGEDEIKFDAIHNLKSFGIDIDDAVINWAHRTKKFTAASFCKYVLSKNESFVCMDSDQYERLSKIGY